MRDQRGHGTSPERYAGEVSIIQITNIVLRNWRVVVAAPLAVAALVVAVVAVLPASYTSRTSFTPESAQSQVSGLANIASQFGISVPTMEAGESLEFYAELLEGRSLLRETVLTEYPVPAGGDAMETGSAEDLVSLLDVEGTTRKVAVARAVETLRDHVDVGTSSETGTVSVSATTRWGLLSQGIAERMVDLVNEFNLERRQSQASAERSFVEEQVDRARAGLHAAEDSLEAFLSRNRRYENSPQLRFEYDRLRRRVTLRQQVFTSLAEAYEQAKIDEVRNTPVITVVEPAEVPARPDPRRFLLKGVLGLVLGAVISLTWAFGREIVRSSRERDPDDYAEFVRLRTRIKDEVGATWRRLRQRMT